MRDFLLDLALQHGEMLLQGANRNGDGWSWKTMPAARDLTGFSHGTAGIAWALLELYAASREQRFLDAAQVEGLGVDELACQGQPEGPTEGRSVR